MYTILFIAVYIFNTSSGMVNGVLLGKLTQPLKWALKGVGVYYERLFCKNQVQLFEIKCY